METVASESGLLAAASVLGNGVWQLPPSHLTLPPQQIHIWCLPLTDADIAGYCSLLSLDEQRRLNRLHGETLQRRFAVGRGRLRVLLGRYLERDPAELQFQYGKYGKPALRSSTPTVQFNLSHSGDLALCAVAPPDCRALGIDLECSRPLAAAELARQFFSPREAEAIALLPPEEGQRAFLRMWTLKEARLKATGVGISEGLAQVEVDLDHPSRCPGEQEWTIGELTVGNGYFGAFAAIGHGWQCHYFQMNWTTKNRAIGL
ncbi:phosphopantetheinyl transferase [Rubidibacter lacunae KORDI 51-2]|uniref:Phosphopantetheinyl transferase n=1 Tax=Rubidibacter lacunae KORDI 51-2 TaxID=582515 RepID=U5DRI1_9CHRO|nr:4'-phosphopantetheinyl transferase superfamily protein [Rubidibacter lacunae]ERN43219.1 phosphopantetheinyl transferase [Rubidibacter lacunae KORDI 51-2]